MDGNPQAGPDADVLAFVGHDWTNPNGEVRSVTAVCLGRRNLRHTRFVLWTTPDQPNNVKESTTEEFFRWLSGRIEHITVSTDYRKPGPDTSTCPDDSPPDRLKKDAAPTPPRWL